MIGDKILFERFLHLYKEEDPFFDQIPFGALVYERIETLLSVVKFGDEDALYLHPNEYQDIWVEAIRNAIICLRKNDKRERREEADDPSTFGTDELKTYFMDYSSFESVLYGGTKYYRDHVLHVVRVWLLGLYILTENNFIEAIKVGDGEEVNNSEKFSIWTLIALTHDLGYPLEKASQILSATRNMMGHFITNPVINMDFNFTGVQDTMNDFIIRLMSSKMVPIEGGRYRNQIQSKYYFKFLKSLEDNKHGVLSSIVIYKMLEYFLESDYSLSEDYLFEEEDKRQFYLRRDILRSISSHTCDSIYQNDILNFSFLLILCDECQEWGRRSFASMYKSRQCDYQLKDVSITKEGEDYRCSIKESYLKITDENIDEVSHFYSNKLNRQFIGYSKWFRDGQSINKRNFSFDKEIIIEHDEGKYPVCAKIEINKQGKSKYSLIVEGKEAIGTSNIGDIESAFEVEFNKSIKSKIPM